MDVYEAIKGRSTIYKFKPTEVPKEKLERILEAGTWAPNRFLTEPWRFWVFTGEGRSLLSRILVEIEKDGMENPDSEENRKRIAKRAQQPFNAPAAIIVGCEVSEKDRVNPIEEVAAVNACVQNMLLAAHAEGLAGFWGTGNYVYHPLFKEFLGLKEKDRVIGVIYIGYPARSKTERSRTHFSKFTKWIDEDKNTTLGLINI
ncbi:nitroreductase family protein [Fonticella tunisiensis]|uniref:Putative NAD(P)H nitroreductase n=1 Tax=Fonticella tunisiensis TaxID=1096341 RepID=A0A4R7KTU0_9CLOT|nr:nitroreductase [Fonticella tunisiensis]TDT62761.1 nitroreductase [Fonticella tunisiensis]